MASPTPMAEQTLSAFRQEASAWRTTPGVILDVLGNEIRKGLLILLAHPASIVLGVVTSIFFYLGIQFVIGQGQLPRDLLPPTLVGFSAYMFLWIASLAMVADLVEEMRTGTLAQTHLSPVSPSLLLLGRLGVASVQGILVAALAAAVPLVVAGIPIPARWEALVPFALTLVNGLAFTLLFAGIALTNPFIGEIHHLITGLIGMFNGAYLPVALFPDWLETVARLLPTTLGIEATLNVLFKQRSLGDLWADGSLLWLLAYTLALTLAGWWVYMRNQRKAMRDGRLG
ncbi:MAG: ABC transporter permease [Chloroflexi bacterium]|nr:ABC transporter permease [Chloroflexota bacterium]MCI0576011.1 ABC transporter permease [Chloroflexota bacterium]MCI0645135.1 ABC transporter permease [Chloroflexota bacterium]MCI0726782.1 ABC transporter permease [Chloroflexota bacterium]